MSKVIIDLPNHSKKVAEVVATYLRIILASPEEPWANGADEYDQAFVDFVDALEFDGTDTVITVEG